VLKLKTQFLEMGSIILEMGNVGSPLYEISDV
jgi:hypothetical protein